MYTLTSELLSLQKESIEVTMVNFVESGKLQVISSIF